MGPSKWITQVYLGIGPVHVQRPDKGLLELVLWVFGDLLVVIVQTLGFEL